MNVVQIADRRCTGPSGWAELSPKQYRQVLTWLDRFDGDPAGRFALLQAWYRIPLGLLRRLDDEQRLALISLLDFLDERPDCWLFPRLRVGRTTYVGPGDGLEHLTFGEFMYAQAARDRYAADPIPAHVADLVAALYRPRAVRNRNEGDGGRRQFDRRRLGEQMAQLRRLPALVQQGIFMNYQGCLDRFPAQFDQLFRPVADPAPGDEGGSWLDVGISLARQTGALGTFAQMEQTNVYLVLTTLNTLMKEAEALKRESEKWT